MDAPQALLFGSDGFHERFGVRRLSECHRKSKGRTETEDDIAKSDAKFNEMINLRRSRIPRLGSGAAKEK